MKLVNLIKQERIFCGLKARDLKEAIKLLVPLVASDYSEESQKRITAEVLERERLVSTIVGRGVAIPHARSTEVTQFVIGIGIFPEGLGDHTVDNEPLKVIFLMLEQNRVTKLFMKSLGVISRLVLMDENIEKIAAASSPADVTNIIDAANLDVAERLSSGDIARRVEPLRLGMNLKDAADLFFRNNTHTLPVLDAQNEVVGILRASDLVNAALPEYAKMIGDLHFLSEFEPFDRFLEKEDEMLVDAVMTKNYYSVDEAAPIIEVASILVHHMETALVVKSEGLYWGMVSLRDVITKVMRV